MNLIRILESDDWFVDYDRERDMYRVSYFEDNHFVDECWFGAYEEKEVNHKDTPIPVKRFEGYNHEWWAGYYPYCGEFLKYNFENGCEAGYRNHYCYKCGQLCDFEDK